MRPRVKRRGPPRRNPSPPVLPMPTACPHDVSSYGIDTARGGRDATGASQAVLIPYLPCLPERFVDAPARLCYYRRNTLRTWLVIAIGGKMTNRIACAALLVCALAFSQTTSSRISGSVTDPQGSAVPAATVTILNPVTGQTFSTVTSAQGEYVVPSVPPATYRITVEAKGFRTVMLNDVKVDAAVPATVNSRLEVGSVSETVEVSAAAEVVQSTSATVSSTLVGRQLVELPLTTRNLVDLVVTQPGSQTPGTPRTTSINGLPKGTINISIDGLNVQDI